MIQIWCISGSQAMIRLTAFASLLALLLSIPAGRSARADDVVHRVEALTQAVAPAVVQWRRDIHAHPELGNREERTAAKVAEGLHTIGVDEIKTGVAHHGVVALIRGGRSRARPWPCGPTWTPCRSRADRPAVRLAESRRDARLRPRCHTAMLLGAAHVLVQIRDQMPGTVKLIFQPAEEGVPAGEEGGARLMVEEGVLRNPDVAAIFALHVNPELDAGKIGYRAGVAVAGVEHFRVTVIGRQSHAGMPWRASIRSSPPPTSSRRCKPSPAGTTTPGSRWWSPSA